MKKCQKNIPDLVKTVLEYRPGLHSRSYLQKMFFFKALKRKKLLKILPKILSSTGYFIFKRTLLIFSQDFFKI